MNYSSVNDLRNHFLGPAFGRTDFSRIFIFEPPDFFRGFSRRIFSPHFFGEKVPRKILQENPRENPPKFIQQKSSDTFLQIGRGNISWTMVHGLELSPLPQKKMSCRPRLQDFHDSVPARTLGTMSSSAKIFLWWVAGQCISMLLYRCDRHLHLETPKPQTK